MFSVVLSAGFDLGMEESDCKRSVVTDTVATLVLRLLLRAECREVTSAHTSMTAPLSEGVGALSVLLPPPLNKS